MMTTKSLAVILLSLTMGAACAADSTKPLSAKEVYAKVGKSIFAIYIDDDKTRQPEFSGSAVAISNDLLATNCHVIEDAKNFYIETDGKQLKGELYSADRDRDVCLIYSDNVTYTPIQIRLARDVEIGEDVYAIGNPQALEKSISKGIISNKHTGKVITLQTDAAIAPGSSGGGLFDNNGELIGLTTAKQGDGIGFVVPSDIIVALILNPKLPDKESTPESSSSVIKEIGIYGADKVGLYSLDDSMCVITLPGGKDARTTTVTAIWMPTDPEMILFFPAATDGVQAITASFDLEFTKESIFPTKEKMALNGQPTELLGLHEAEPYEVLAAVLEQNPMTAFLDNKDLMLQLTDKKSPTGYQDIHFRLNGFKEAISAYHSNCH